MIFWVLNHRFPLIVDEYKSLLQVWQKSLHGLQPSLMFLVDYEATIGNHPFADKFSFTGFLYSSFACFSHGIPSLHLKINTSYPFLCGCYSYALHMNYLA